MRLDLDNQLRRNAVNRAIAWFAVCAILLQALWVPWHLATEHHVMPGQVRGVPDVECLAAPFVSPVFGVANSPACPAHPQHPHSILDHKVVQEARADVAPLPQTPLAQPMRSVWAPPRAGPQGSAPAFAVRSLPDDPGSTAARPRAPPRAAALAS